VSFAYGTMRQMFVAAVAGSRVKLRRDLQGADPVDKKRRPTDRDFVLRPRVGTENTEYLPLPKQAHHCIRKAFILSYI